MPKDIQQRQGHNAGPCLKFSGFGVWLWTEHPEWSKVTCEGLTMFQVGCVLRVDLQDV